MRTYKVTVQVGSRAYSEILSMSEYRKYFDESTASERTTWGEWTRPVSVDDLNSLNGNHLLFGFFESLWQSDRSPFFCLTEANPDDDWTYTFE